MELSDDKMAEFFISIGKLTQSVEGLRVDFIQLSDNVDSLNRTMNNGLLSRVNKIESCIETLMSNVNPDSQQAVDILTDSWKWFRKQSYKIYMFGMLTFFTLFCWKIIFNPSLKTIFEFFGLGG